MSQLAEQLADLTGFRDRDVLDVSLAFALRELLRPLSVGIYRPVGEPGKERWFTRARLAAQDAVAACDPAWAELDSLPEMDAFALRAESLRTGRPGHSNRGASHLSVFPLAANQQVIGVLEFETEAPMDDPSQRLIDSVLRIFGNFQSLLDYSERDTLTGLLNRKTFDDSFLKLTGEAVVDNKFAAEERRMSVAGIPQHWLGVVDIDHFKRVNDSFGHLIGDEVLLLVARLMRSSFRFYDRLYRFGGEEFVILVRCGSVAAAGVAFERFRAKVEGHAFPQIGNITVSIGFTEIKPGDAPSAAFERADKAVYYAKSNGRNRVVGHADLVARGELQDTAKVGDVELF